MMDIDNFKKVNDTYGHLVGDEIFKIVAYTLSSNVKKTDMVKMGWRRIYCACRCYH